MTDIMRISQSTRCSSLSMLVTKTTMMPRLTESIFIFSDFNHLLMWGGAEVAYWSWTRAHGRRVMSSSPSAPEG
ncbi:hypothetical protein TNCV_4381231 [Trichonephila clavipes]|nr:hypothetical protein TNCV_4381231 [Trichonephila clavipes]